MGLPLLAFILSTLFTLCTTTVRSSADVIGTSQKHSIVTVKESVTVPVNERMENVVVLGGDVAVSGTVSDTVLAVRGNVHLLPSARVGMLIELGGKVTQEPGSHVDEIYKLSFNQPIWDSAAVGSFMVIGVWTLRLAISALLIVVPVIFYASFRRILGTPMRLMENSRRRTGLIGFLATVCVLLTSAIFAITLVGLPVTVFLVLLTGAIGFIGMACVATKLGEWSRLVPDSEPLTWRHTVAGSVLITAFTNIPLVGPLFLFIVWCIGMGLMTEWCFKRIQQKRANA